MISKKKTAKSYIVFQGRGHYEEEYACGFICAPYYDDGDREPHFWKRLTEPRPGDRLFHYSKGYIMAISTVTTSWRDFTIGEGEEWSRDGRRVDCNPVVLDEPIKLSDFKEDIIKYKKEKYSAFNKHGNVNQGYLYELEPELAEIFRTAAGIDKPEEPEETILSGKAVEVAEALLKLIANRTRLITYGELSDMTESKPSAYYEMRKLLDSINRRCYELDLPYISAMVINKNTGLPGKGFRDLCIEAFGYDSKLSSKEIFEAELDKIGKCDEWDKLADSIGIAMPSEDEELLPEEVKEDPGEPIAEGAKKTIIVNSYERDPKAKKICKDHYMKIYGRITCQVCGFDFGEEYGPEYSNKIHIHHIRPVSEIGEKYVVDPIKDLIPVCPNCHMVLHAGKGIRVDELKRKLKRDKRQPD